MRRTASDWNPLRVVSEPDGRISGPDIRVFRIFRGPARQGRPRRRSEAAGRVAVPPGGRLPAAPARPTVVALYEALKVAWSLRTKLEIQAGGGGGSPVVTSQGDSRVFKPGRRRPTFTGIEKPATIIGAPRGDATMGGRGIGRRPADLAWVGTAQDKSWLSTVRPTTTIRHVEGALQRFYSGGGQRLQIRRSLAASRVRFGGGFTIFFFLSRGLGREGANRR